MVKGFSLGAAVSHVSPLGDIMGVLENSLCIPRPRMIFPHHLLFLDLPRPRLVGSAKVWDVIPP